MPLGKYIVYETQAPKGYLLNETIFNANIQYVNSTTPVVELKIEGVVDTEPKGSIEIIKNILSNVNSHSNMTEGKLISKFYNNYSLLIYLSTLFKKILLIVKIGHKK